MHIRNKVPHFARLFQVKLSHDIEIKKNDFKVMLSHEINLANYVI